MPEDLINKIAAGEVVERPASVVKELVENSIDAGADRIVVEIEDGGKKLIRVSDNGCGMTEKEISLSLERHSTSKIRSVDDLFNIRTLGFRGEALPSIASISHLKIEKNPSAGLTIEVKDLFHNTPVRRKFLKSNATEIGRCGDIIAKYVLAYPGISFKYVSDGKTLLFSSGVGDLLAAVIAVYGAAVARELLPVNHSFGSGKVAGMISRPTISRVDKGYENFFVNSRYVRSFLLNRALEETYRTYIPNNRYPIAILSVTIDPGEVDVNVHPTKIEVKFMKNQEVMEAVRSASRSALKTITPVSSGSQDFSRQPQNYNQNVWEPQTLDGFFAGENTPAVQAPSDAVIGPEQPLIPLYQLKQAYIVATDGSGLSVIDQHAAHERIIYDQLSRQGEKVNVQALLLPETIELELPAAVVVKENLSLIQSFGFEVEEFGRNSFILRGIPAISGKNGGVGLFVDIANDLLATGKSDQVEAKKENLRKSVACHGAVKAGEPMTTVEMTTLIRNLFLTENPTTCPHGRPLIFGLTEIEIEKKFHR